jgi:acetoin:2,6-dichlorophenolindophenol oxidoreductase subunit alpha
MTSMTEPIRIRGSRARPSALLDAMIRIRGIEAALQVASVEGLLEGPVHVSLGQEAAAVGLAKAMRADDVLLSNHRGHAHALALGLDPYRVIAEIVGHRDGLAQGRGGSMHLFDPEAGFLGTNVIVGGNAGVVLGAAMALQIEGRPRAAVVVFGDGAMGSGIVYESFNLAVLWKLPVLFVCENNGYAELTPTRVHLSSPPADRARAFGLHAASVDGIDVAAVAQAAHDSLKRARAGTPAFLEIRSFRFGGHYAADAARYRPEGEDDLWRRTKCPIADLARKIGAPAGEAEGAVERLRDEVLGLVKELAR